MAEPNYILVGRVFKDPSKSEIVGYWGISLALGCVYVYRLQELTPTVQKIVSSASFDPHTDYIIKAPNDTIIRLQCTGQADILINQKGNYTVVPNKMNIEQPNIVRVTPSYKYTFSSGFGVNNIVESLSSLSVLSYGDSDALFHGNYSNKLAPIRECSLQVTNNGRKRIIMAYRAGSEGIIQIPYGITGIRLDGVFKTVLIPETVEEVRGVFQIENLTVAYKYFAQNLLTIAPKLTNDCRIENLNALHTSTILLRSGIMCSTLNCSGEVLFDMTREKGTLLDNMHISPNSMYKPLGEANL